MSSAASLSSTITPIDDTDNERTGELVQLPVRHPIARPFKNRVPGSWEASQRIPSGDGPDWIGYRNGVWGRCFKGTMQYTDGEYLIEIT